MKITQDITIIVLAAGNGTRMCSDTPKVLHKVAGRCLLEYIVDLADKLNNGDVRVVLNNALFNAQEISDLSSRYNFHSVLQKQQDGTGGAVKAAIEFGPLKDTVLVLYADSPFVKEETVTALLDKIYKEQVDISLLAFHPDNPKGYGRLLIDSNNGNVTNIIEEADLKLTQKDIDLCNAGTIAFKSDIILDFIKNYKQDLNKEYYITDIVSFAAAKKKEIAYIKATQQEVQGINNKIQLAEAESYVQKMLKNFWMEKGVTMLDPDSVFLSYDAILAKDVTIYPNVYIGNKVIIGRNTQIMPFCHIENACIGENAVIGPFARIRVNSEIGNNTKIGNFVEVKKSIIEENTKIMHLSYVGDVKIGKSCNIGAGVVFCNYNGKVKSKCKVGNNAFVGSNSSIIAPRQIGSNVTIGAGSVITEDIEDNTLALSRVQQENLKKS